MWSLPVTGLSFTTNEIATMGRDTAFTKVHNRLPMLGTQVPSLVWEDPTCLGATKPVSHAREPVLCNKRSPGTTTREQLLLIAVRESLCAAKTQHSQKLEKKKKIHTK